jgi:hypothetical protein
MKIKKYTLTFLLIVLLLNALACTIFVGGPEYSTQTVPASTGEVQSMQTQVEQALIAGAETGVVTLQITESQLTSYMALKMQEQPNPPFTEPQVYLRNGQMQMYGKIDRGMFAANMLITMNVGIDPITGLPKFEIASADFGPFPAPEGLNTAISVLIDEAFTGSLGPVAIGFRLESVTIADGSMTMTGRIK